MVRPELANSNATQNLACVCPLRSQPEVDALIALFSSIAHEEGWQPDGQLDTYRDRSTYFGLRHTGTLTERPTLIGGLQLVCLRYVEAPPSHAVWPDVAVGIDAAHIAVLAVEKAWRGKSGGLFWLLAVEMWRYCVGAGVRELWLEATPRTLQCYQRLGWPLHIRGELRMHWGEPCYLCSMEVREVAGSLVERALKSASYRGILELAVAARPEKV